MSAEGSNVGSLRIRKLDSHVTWSELTELLHRAYAPLAARGLRFYATYQDDRATRERAEEGECYVAFVGDVLAGTITAYGGGRENGCRWYRMADTASMGQFGVDPAFQGRGIGRAFMDLAERRAVERGARRIVIDTSEHAAELIATYRRRGYDIVDTHQWDETNYRSVVLVKTLR